MASDESSPQEIGFLSDKDIEDTFEREKVFTDELENQTLARLSWMLTKHRAAFLVIAHELGVDPDIAAKLSTAQVFLSRQFADFVSIGLDAAHDATSVKHPLEEALDELSDEITEPGGMQKAVESLAPVGDRMTVLVCGVDEELLHSLERFRPHTDT